MKSRDQLSGLFWLALAIFVCAESSQVTVGTFHSPGPGFFPFWLGILLGAFSILLLLKNLLSKEKEKIGSVWKAANWGRVLLVPLSLFAYALLLPKLGYLLSTSGLMILLFVAIERRKIWMDILIAVTVVLVSYLIFHLWLGVSLPKGLFYF
jgi:hypothetical protein